MTHKSKEMTDLDNESLRPRAFREQPLIHILIMIISIYYDYDTNVTWLIFL